MSRELFSEKFPESHKLSNVRELSQAIGEFLEDLGSGGVVLATHHEHTKECEPIPRRRPDETPAGCGLREDELVPLHKSIQTLLADHFGIDLDKLEEEKRKMLESLR